MLYRRVELILKSSAAENRADKNIGFSRTQAGFVSSASGRKRLQADGLKEKPAWVGGGQVS